MPTFERIDWKARGTNFRAAPCEFAVEVQEEMDCPECGETIPAEKEICPECGYEVQ